MTQLTRRPLIADSSGLADYPELSPDVGRVQGTACPRAEDKTFVAPLRPGGEPLRRLALLMGPERIDRHLGQAERPA
jgi:hypothetical protein